MSQFLNRVCIVKSDHFEPKRVSELILYDAPVHGEHIAPVLDRLVLVTSVDAFKSTFEMLPLVFNVHGVHKFKLLVDHGLTVVGPHVVPAVP